MAAQTVRMTITACGVDDVNLWNGMTKSERISNELFNNDFNTFRDIKYEEIQEEVKSYSRLTAAQGQIRLNPGVKRNIRALIQWVQHQYRCGIIPGVTLFPLGAVTDLLRQEASHEAYVKKSKNIVDSAKLVSFTLDTKWQDWYPVFINFLRNL